MNFIDINDSFSYLKLVTQMVNSKEELDAFTASLDFSNHIYSTPNGQIAYDIKDNNLFYLGNGNENDLNTLKQMLLDTNYDLTKISKPFTEKDMTTLSSVEVPYFLIDSKPRKITNEKDRK